MKSHDFFVCLLLTCLVLDFANTLQFDRMEDLLDGYEQIGTTYILYRQQFHSVDDCVMLQLLFVRLDIKDTLNCTFMVSKKSTLGKES